MRKISFEFVLVLLIVFGISSIRLAAGKSNLILIFDASGSMWGQIDGKAKITIAKEAMDLIVNDLPLDINIGLIAYGHRRKGDCDDVETLIPLGSLNAKEFLAKINALSPKGKTPMVRSIRKTAEAIKHLEDETTILLVSDGEETCDPEPCNFVAELEKLGIKFVLHVVGFDVGGKTEEQLKCMAKAGGGEYFPAKDAGRLKSALDAVVKKAVARNLIVTCLDANEKPLSVMIQIVDSSGRVIATDGGKRVGFGLPAGTYTLRVNPDNLTENRIVEGVVVAENEVTQTEVVFAKSQIIVSVKDGGQNNINGYIRIINLTTGQSAEEGNHTGQKTGFIVSPGKYLVDVECSNTGKRIKSESFTIQAGESRDVSCICANVRIGVLVVDAVGKAVTGYIRLIDVVNDISADEADSGSAMRFFKVPPGRYKVDVECPGGERLRSEIFDIQQGQENQVIVNCGTKKIESRLPGVNSGAASSIQESDSGSATVSPSNQNKQTTRKTVSSTATAAQIQADAQAQAAAAQTNVLAEMQGTQPTQPSQANQVQTNSATGNLQTEGAENPKDIALPKVADGPTGYFGKNCHT